jgi:BsuBI/PstI restriction endonuclease domain
MTLLPVQLADGTEIHLSPGEHGALICDIIHEFAPCFAPGSALIYAGDIGDKLTHLDRERLEALGVSVDEHGQMPDVVIHDVERNWLFLIETVTNHGPINGKHPHKLAERFAGSSASLIYFTAFPTRAVMARYLGEIAWESEVWVANEPTHLIHFNGGRFLGPYAA